MQEKYARSIYRMNRETMDRVDEEVEDNSKALEDRRETHEEKKMDRKLQAQKRSRPLLRPTDFPGSEKVGKGARRHH